MKNIQTFLIGFLSGICMILLMGQASNQNLDKKHTIDEVYNIVHEISLDVKEIKKNQINFGENLKFWK